jgi:hypothetical protein
MQTIMALRFLVMSLGGTLEQDSGGRFKVWQCVAPAGRIWRGGSKHVRLEWMPGVSTSRQERARVIEEAGEIVKFGHREMTPQERFECDEPV